MQVAECPLKGDAIRSKHTREHVRLWDACEQLSWKGRNTLGTHSLHPRFGDWCYKTNIHGISESVAAPKVLLDEEHSAGKVNLLDNITSRALAAVRCYGDMGKPPHNSEEQHVETKHRVGILRSKIHRRETREIVSKARVVSPGAQQTFSRKSRGRQETALYLCTTCTML